MLNEWFAPKKSGPSRNEKGRYLCRFQRFLPLVLELGKVDFNFGLVAEFFDYLFDLRIAHFLAQESQ